MSELASINISHAIACDDIRQEISGKHILIGVYSGNLGLPFFPSQIALGFWMLAKPSVKGNYHVQFRVQAPDRTEAIIGNMAVQVGEKEDIALVIPPVPIPIVSPGDITLQYREGDGAWNTVCRLEAKLVPPSPPPV